MVGFGGEGIMHALKRGCGDEFIEAMLLTQIVADCGGTVHGSGGESAVGAGTAK